MIDIFGDGWNNKGRAPSQARDEVVARRVTINGLAITDFQDGLVDYFREEVIGGPGAFAIAAEGFKDFARAVRKKLLQELNVSGLPWRYPISRRRASRAASYMVMKTAAAPANRSSRPSSASMR